MYIKTNEHGQWIQAIACQETLQLCVWDLQDSALVYLLTGGTPQVGEHILHVSLLIWIFRIVFLNDTCMRRTTRLV